MSQPRPVRLPRASLIICSRERPQLLLETVESVFAGDALPDEIVIVDQSAAPHPVLSRWEQTSHPAVHYLHSGSTGLSRARNEAIAAARCDILVIIDDDMFVERSWFGTLVRELLNEGERSVVTGRVLPAGDQKGGFVPALATSPEHAVYSGRLDRDVLAGGHMAAFRQALEQIGGFDERLGAGSHYPAADDNDLGFRLLEAGYRIVYVPQAIVYHRAWRPKREYVPVRWRYGRGKGGFYAKHAGGSAGAAMRGRMARDVGRRLLGLPRRLVRDPRGAAGDLAYSLGVVAGAVEWALNRQKTR